MMKIIAKLRSGWHGMRIFRMGVGIAAAIEAVRMHDYAIGLLAIFFLYQGITDTGCCSTASCFTEPPKNNKKIEDIQYEEIK